MKDLLAKRPSAVGLRVAAVCCVLGLFGCGSSHRRGSPGFEAGGEAGSFEEPRGGNGGQSSAGASGSANGARGGNAGAPAGGSSGGGGGSGEGGDATGHHSGAGGDAGGENTEGGSGNAGVPGASGAPNGGSPGVGGATNGGAAGDDGGAAKGGAPGDGGAANPGAAGESGVANAGAAGEGAGASTGTAGEGGGANGGAAGDGATANGGDGGDDSANAGASGEGGRGSEPGECTNGDTEALPCGLNLRGRAERSCVLGTWGEYGECDDPDRCKDGAERAVACGAGTDAHTRETCSSGAWTVTEPCACDDVLQILACDGSCIDYPDRVYVDAANTGCADGTSWETALPQLTAAFDGPYYLATQFWVAEGTYYPGEPGAHTGTSFDLGGYAVYGGFAGTESSLDERDPALHPTILSGDLNRNGSPDSGDSASVVRVQQTGAVIDGFTITSGYAPEHGGGLATFDSRARVRGCTFKGNRAGYGGAAIFVDGDVGIDVADSTFTDNYVYRPFNTSAGVILVSGVDATNEAQQPLTTIVNSVFHGNNAGPIDAEGSVLSVRYARATIVNSLFYDNVLRCEPAIQADFHGTVRIHGSTIADNDWICGGCPGCVPGASAFDGADLYLTNVIAQDSVIAYNRAGVATSTLTATYTNHPTLLTGTGNTDTAPAFVSPGTGNYCLIPGPGIDAGHIALLPADTLDLDDDGDVSEPIPFDLHGNARVSGASVDQGACELQQ